MSVMSFFILISAILISSNYTYSMMEYISDVTFTVYYQSKFILKLADLTIYKQHRKELQFLRSVINDVSTKF